MSKQGTGEIRICDHPARCRITGRGEDTYRIDPRADGDEPGREPPGRSLDARLSSFECAAHMAAPAAVAAAITTVYLAVVFRHRLTGRPAGHGNHDPGRDRQRRPPASARYLG